MALWNGRGSCPGGRRTRSRLFTCEYFRGRFSGDFLAPVCQASGRLWAVDNRAAAISAQRKPSPCGER